MTGSILAYSVGEVEDDDGNIDELEKLSVSVPHYGWSGSIDKDTLEERIDDRLADIKTPKAPKKKDQLDLFEEKLKYIKRFK